MTVDFSSVDRSHVLQALAEYDELGAEAFHDTHGFGPAGTHLLVHDGRSYDAEAVLGVARRYATGTAATSSELHAADETVDVLVGLGFTVEAGPEPEVAPPRDISEVGPEVARAAWAEAARTVLVEAARRYRALVTHRQLATTVQERTGITTSLPVQRWLFDVLGRLTDECQALGEPLLPSLCVSAQKSVGAEYADAVEHARGARPTDPDEHAAVERLDCYRHWDAAGLPRDGGTPLRTAHFTTVRKAPARRSALRSATASRAPARTSTAAASAPKPVALCPTCFTAVPATGVCDYCD